MEEGEGGGGGGVLWEVCCRSGTRVILSGDVRQGWSDRPTSIRLLNLSIYMYIHIHELLDHAPLPMHLALLEKTNLRPPPWQLTEKDCSAQVTKDWQGLVLNHYPDVGQWKQELIAGLVNMTPPFTLGVRWIVGSSINTSPKGGVCLNPGDERNPGDDLQLPRFQLLPPRLRRPEHLGPRAGGVCLGWGDSRPLTQPIVLKHSKKWL